MQITEHTRLHLRLQNSLFIILLITAIGLAAWLSTRYKLQADWTYNHRHTLSVASQKLLTEFTAPIIITAYASKNKQIRQSIKELIQRYQKYKSDIQLNFVDPYTVPNEVREKNIEVDGELLINYQDKTEQVTTPRLSEQEISSVLQRLIRSDKPIVAFLTGHGERSITNFAGPDLSEWAQELKQRGFDVQAINFGQSSLPLETIKVLVIASPQSKLLPAETTLIEQYLNQGGNLLWLLDSNKLFGLEPLATQLGLTIQPGILVDPTSRLFGVNDPSVISITTTGYGHHPVTADLTEQLTLFPQAIGLVVEPPSEAWEKNALLTTHPQVWSETGKIAGTVKYDPKTDINGPLTIAVALSREKPKQLTQTNPVVTPNPTTSGNQVEALGNEITTAQPPAAIEVKPATEASTTDTNTSNSAKQRVIIIGDGDCLSNALLGFGGQLDLGLKIINWLAQDDNLIKIPAKAALDLKLELSSNLAIFLGLLFLFILPGTLIGTGISIWLRRRRA